MPKYYISSGRVRRVIDREDPVSAARFVVRSHARAPSEKKGHRAAVAELGLMTAVSERGFRSKKRQLFPTHYLLVGEE